MSMSNLASSLRAVGDNQAALDLDREVLETRKQVLGPQHPDTLNSEHNLKTTEQSLSAEEGTNG
jgi:hypothetical protein